MNRVVSQSRAFSVLLVICVFSVVPARKGYAAVQVPVHFSVGDLPQKPVKPGATFSFILDAQIQPGWHLYALEEPEGGPIATEIGLADGDPLTMVAVDEPKPLMQNDPVLHAETGMFQNSAKFTLRVRAPKQKIPPNSVSHVLVRFQVCNEHVCLPPRTETVTVPLDGVVSTATR